MALATQTDVEQRIQVLFDDPAEPVIATLIAAAQSQYEREAGRLLEAPASDYVETYDPPLRDSKLFLRHPPVITIDSVTEDGTLLVVTTDYYFTTVGLLERVNVGLPRLWNTRKRQSVVVTYTGGYDATHFMWNAINDDVAWMVAAAFQRGAAAASDSGALEGVESEQIGTHILRYMASVGDTSQWLAMTADQRARAQDLRIVAVA